MRNLLYFLILLFPLNVFSQGVKVNTGINKGNLGKSPVSAGGNYSWNQARNGAASAGVYNTSNQLVRTLFSNVWYSSGQHTQSWDGMLDDSTPAPVARYTIKVLTSQVSASWEGTYIENTCDSATGTHHARAYNSPTSVCVVGDTSYWSLLYGEAFAPQFYRSIANPQSEVNFYGFGGGTYVNNYNCTDGNTVYNCINTDNNQKCFVWAIDVATHTRHSFSSGRTVAASFSGNWVGVIDTSVSQVNAISGIAVQKRGNYLFVSRHGINRLHVLNKTTGALVQSITITTPSKVTITADDRLWVQHDGRTLEKYTVNADGTLTSTGLTIVPTYNIGAIAVSTSNTTLSVADMDNCLLKQYSNTTGSLLATLGTQDGYKTDATVTYNKWYWHDSAGAKSTFITYLPDNSFYLEDGENRRTLRLDSAGNFISQIFLFQATYSVSVDPNNPARIWDGYKEFSIDYTKPLAANNGSWTLIKNWGYDPSTTVYGGHSGASLNMNAVSLSNGRTYGLLQSGSTNPFYNYVVELVMGATMRNTGIHVSVSAYIDKDGSLVSPTYIQAGSSSPYVVQRRTLTGFDGNNNPIWGTAVTLCSVSDTSIAAFKTNISANTTIGYDISAGNYKDNKDYHLEFIDNTTNTLKAKGLRGTVRAYSGPFPDGGYFDNGNTVNIGSNGAGGFVSSYNNITVANYHGEFYKQGQTNKFFVYDNNTGLEIYQFGTVGADYRGQAAPAGVEGNVISGDLAYNNGTLYLYTNGESFGIHRWKMNNPNSVTVQTALYPSFSKLPAEEGIDLMPSTRRYSNLTDGTDGVWHMSANYFTDKLNYFQAATGNRSYDQFKKPDLTIRFNSSSRTDYVTRDLGNNRNTTKWKIGGDLLLNPYNYNEGHGYEGQNIQVLDNTGKVIADVYITQVPQQNLMGNNAVIVPNLASNAGFPTGNYFQPFEISYAGGVLTFRYADNTAKATVTREVGAMMNNPATLRFKFFCNNPAARVGMTRTIRDLRFTAQ